MSDDNLGVLRIHGRLDNFRGDEPIVRPIVLPSKSKLVRMYAEHMHQSLGHQGYRVVIVNLRKNGVYIIRGKQLLKSIAAKCIRCRIMRRELLTQQMVQLPSFRFKAYCPPFTSVAMNFFGPVKIKKTRNIAISGCVLVIACNMTRIIHLEITETQSTDNFLLAWRRFVTKRGIHPLHVYTDQGKTFVGAQKYIKEWLSRWDGVAIHDQLATQGTAIRFTWDFNTLLASHVNGTVESLIRSCRKAFNAASDYLRRSYLHSEWETIVAEANYLVNSRPLFPKSVEDLDEEPITGNSLLYPFDGQHVPQHECDIDVRMSVKLVQGFVKRFWESWIRNMPPQLVSCEK